MALIRRGERRQRRPRGRHEHAEHALLGERIGRFGDDHGRAAREGVGDEAAAVLLEPGDGDEALARRDLARVRADARHPSRDLALERPLRQLLEELTRRHRASAAHRGASSSRATVLDPRVAPAAGIWPTTTPRPRIWTSTWRVAKRLSACRSVFPARSGIEGPAASAGGRPAPDSPPPPDAADAPAGRGSSRAGVSSPRGRWSRARGAGAATTCTGGVLPGGTPR